MHKDISHLSENRSLYLNRTTKRKVILRYVLKVSRLTPDIERVRDGVEDRIYLNALIPRIQL